MDEEIDTLEKLEAWLKRPAWESAPLSTRMAQRVLPFAVNAAQVRDFGSFPRLILALFRLGALSSTVGHFPRDVRRSAAAAAQAAAVDGAELLKSAPSAMTNAVTAAIEATKAAASGAHASRIAGGTFSARHARRDIAHRAATSGALVARAAIDMMPDTAAFWQAVQDDVRWLDEHDAHHGSSAANGLLAHPLWPTPFPSWFAGAVDTMYENLLETKAGFELWLDHYARRIVGRETGFALAPEQDLELHQRFIAQDDSWWNRDPAAVNADIAAWLDELTPDLAAARLETFQVRLESGRKPDLTKPEARAALDELLKVTGAARSAIRNGRAAGIGHNQPPDGDFEDEAAAVRQALREPAVEEALKAIDARLRAIEKAAGNREPAADELIAQASWLHRLTCWIPDKTKDGFQEKFGEHGAMLVLWGIPAICLGLPKIIELIIQAIASVY